MLVMSFVHEAKWKILSGVMGGDDGSSPAVPVADICLISPEG